MAAKRGRDLLLKFDPDRSGALTTVAGLRTRRLAFDAQVVDVTDAESAGRWRELLAAAGVQRASIEGAGIFKDAASDALIRGAFFDGAIGGWSLVLPAFGTVSGPFQIARLEYAGRHDGEVTFEIALESAGPVAFEVA